mmetsp:Transcript_23687/g.77105  ORF Transcript_23687/g.77105 Transcript_23687/m.77105 type:complete len:119 (+) Transcript_23687:482-838(+)
MLTSTSSFAFGDVRSINAPDGRPFGKEWLEGKHGKAAEELSLRVNISRLFCVSTDTMLQFSSAAGVAKEAPSKQQELQEAASGVELYFYSLLAISTVLIFTLSGEDAHISLAAVLAGW